MKGYVRTYIYAQKNEVFSRVFRSATGVFAPTPIREPRSVPARPARTEADQPPPARRLNYNLSTSYFHTNTGLILTNQPRIFKVYYKSKNICFFIGIESISVPETLRISQ